METVHTLIDSLLFLLFAVQVGYLSVFSFASRLRRKPLRPVDNPLQKRILLLIAAYREDRVILDTVKACLAQDYPHDHYQVLVISDHMSEETNSRLRSLPIEVLQVDFEKSTNTKSLKAALTHVGPDAPYDIVLVVDADNIIGPTYLTELNAAFACPGVQVVQTHRTAKNLNTNMAYLDAVSEEINNSIFRLGHANLHASAALIGSGMAFEYPLFYRAMMTNTSVGGFDRVLEMKLLYEGVFFHYLPDTRILDEKIQKLDGFYNQRRRWLAAQYYSFGEFAHYLWPAIKAGRWGFCDKLYQQISFSRVLLLGFTFIFSVVGQLFFPAYAAKWWALFGLLLLTLGMAIPQRLWTWRLAHALILVPYSFLLMFANLFRMGEANRRFIHTTHGG